MYILRFYWDIFISFSEWFHFYFFHYPFVIYTLLFLFPFVFFCLFTKIMNVSQITVGNWKLLMLYRCHVVNKKWKLMRPSSWNIRISTHGYLHENTFMHKPMCAHNRNTHTSIHIYQYAQCFDVIRQAEIPTYSEK